MSEPLYVERKGADRPPVLLLHGLNCNGAVWDPLVELLLHERFGTIAPDFPGHGRSAWAQPYSLGRHAAAVSAALPRDRPVHIIGHSMGGAVGLLLASGVFGAKVRSVLAIGMKIDWSDDELQRMGGSPRARTFSTRAEAAQRFLRVAGLTGLMSENHRCVQSALVEDADGVRLATDPSVVSVVNAPIKPVLACAQASGAPMRLACGGEDALVGIESLRKWDKEAVLFKGLGHNAHLNAEVVLETFLGQDAVASTI